MVLISEFKLEGRFFRTLLSTLQSVCADNTIDIDVKMFVLHKVLNKCDERLFLDKALIVLAPELCKKHSFEFNNDTILEALVKLYKMDKELEKRIREALENSNEMSVTHVVKE